AHGLGHRTEHLAALRTVGAAQHEVATGEQAAHHGLAHVVQGKQSTHLHIVGGYDAGEAQLAAQQVGDEGAAGGTGDARSAEIRISGKGRHHARHASGDEGAVGGEVVTLKSGAVEIDL